MIFPYGLSGRGEEKNEKKFAITKIVLIFVVLFDFRAVLHCFGCPFQNENRMFECPLYHSSTRKYKHESGFSPYNEVEVIVRGLFLFYI